MTCDLKLLNKPKDVGPIPITLPNGAHTMASKQGTTVPGEKLFLNKVLHVPKLNCNLVSVAKLTKDMNCIVTFSDEFCVLQDHTLRTVIGVGEQRDEVYYYKGAPMIKTQANAVNFRDLWHNHVRHL